MNDNPKKSNILMSEKHQTKKTNISNIRVYWDYFDQYI